MSHMTRPVLFVIDDDAGMVGALGEDLSRRFGSDFRVIGETSVTTGLATLGRLTHASEPVALLIVDHDMPQMPGVDFLARAHEGTTAVRLTHEYLSYESNAELALAR
jgi:DNA-binding NarL/FixJ family response regulator